MTTFSEDHVRFDLRKSLDWAAAKVTLINRDKGWYDADRTFGDDIALLHSEASEMLEAYRDYGTEDVTNPLCPYREHHINKNGPANEGHLCKPEGVGSEAADVLVRLLDTCARYNIDL